RAASAAADAAVAAASRAARAAASAYAWGAVSSDASEIAAGASPEYLAGRPLWLEGVPARWSERWEGLRHALEAVEGEQWSVWTRWYEARLAGSEAAPINFALERARVLIPDDDWKRGPAHVNALIADLIKKFEGGDGSGEDEEQAAPEEDTEEESAEADLEALLRAPELRATLVDYSLDRLARLIRRLPFAEDVPELDDPALRKHREDMLRELAMLMQDLADDVQKHCRNAPGTVQIELERYAEAAGAGIGTVMPGRLWDVGLVLVDMTGDADVEWALGNTIFRKFERAVDKHADLMRAYFASALARLRRQKQLELAQDAEPAQAIEALELAVEGLDQMASGEVRPEDEIAAAAEHDIRQLRTLLDRLERSRALHDGRERELIERFWEKAKPALIGVVRLKLRILQQAPTVIGGLASVEALIPGSLKAAVELIERIIVNLPRL
ncbi:MAG: hypothetical protein AAF074_23785, partial [Pseudomonadota bacterium]